MKPITSIDDLRLDPQNANLGTEHGVKCVCQNCGKVFYVQPARIKHGRGKDCSLACSYKSRARRASRKVGLICPICGRAFEVKRYRIQEGAKYCSRICAHKSPEWSANLSASLKRATRNPESIAKMQATKRLPKQREAQRQRTLAQWADPDQRQSLLAGIRRRSESAEWRKRQREGSRRRSDSKEWQEANRGKRRQDTDIEIALAEGMRDVGLVFQKQYPFGRFTPDFAFESQKLFVMADGEYWHSLSGNQDCDRRFEQAAKNQGWRVLRFNDKQIKRQLSAVLATIEAIINA